MKFDAVVIGSGQGGNPLAHKLADLGWSVALAEEAQLGGTCVNTGCTPTKTMMASAQVAYYAKQAARWGVHTGPVSVDLGAVVARKNKIVERFRSGQQSNVDKRKTLRLYRGHARFLDARTVAVGDERITSEKFFIDTGARTAVPQIEGMDSSGYLDNATIMNLGSAPEHLLIIGAGYIGLEFGQMFARFGSHVTIVNHGNQILPREDADVAEELQKALEAEGIRFESQANVRRVERHEGRGESRAATMTLTMDMPQGTRQLSGSHLLVATGRKPNTAELGLERAGVETDQAGYIRVNGRLETNVPGIWALGDVKGGPAFTHISYNDYQVIWANLIEGQNLSIENRYVPYALFTDPQMGRVGLTEKDARAKGYRLKIGTVPMSRVARAIERDETAGFMKLVVDASNDRILGACVLASEGGELVQLLGVAMMAGAPYTLLKGAVFIHPTLAEGFWPLMEAVKPVDQRAANV